MLILIGILERIMLWMQKHQPDYAASFSPGLCIDEIKVVERELGFELPQEIYTLYQWRNGTEDDAKALIFPTMQFLPLDRAVYYSQGINENFILGQENQSNEISTFFTSNEISNFFVFIEDNGEYYGIPASNSQTEKFPVINVGEGGASVLYGGITDMMLTLADSYETGAYYLDNEGYVCGFHQ
jgi:cell wall assembly regulator SMI1